MTAAAKHLEIIDWRQLELDHAKRLSGLDTANAINKIANRRRCLGVVQRLLVA
jgi:hypothetical protein